MSGEGKLSVIAALVGNTLIASFKLAAGIVANSAALLAEAAHSFSDVGNQLLLLVGMAQSKRPPSEKHPFGTGKAAFFWSFMVAILLFGIAGAYSFVEGIEKTLHPHELDDIRLGLVVLAVAFVIEAASISVALRQARQHAREQGIRGVREFLGENRDAVLLTIFVEDGLALISLPIAAAALGLAKWTGNPRWDGVGSIVIGLFLIGFSLFLGWEVKQLLLGRGLSRRDSLTVKRILEADPAIGRLLSFRTMYLGQDAVLLGAEFSLQPRLGPEETKSALVRIEAALVEALPVLRYVYLEPSGTTRPIVGHSGMPS